MAQKTILLVCAAGLSTKRLVDEMKKRASEKGIEADISTVPASQADDRLGDQSVDVLLLGPQVRFMKSQFEEKLAGKDTAVDVISSEDYRESNGGKILQTALELA